MRSTFILQLLISISLALFVMPLDSSAQQSSIQLSKHADFSTEDRQFTQRDILYVKVIASHVNAADLDKNRLELSPLQGGGDIEKKFQHISNGTFTGQFDLNTLNITSTNWEVEARLEDNNEREFRQKINIVISNNDGTGDDDSSDDGSGDDGSGDDDSGDDGSGDDGSGDDGSDDGGSGGDGSGDDGSGDDDSGGDGSDDGGSGGDGSGDDGSGDDGSGDDDSGGDGSDDDGSGGDDGSGDDGSGDDGSGDGGSGDDGSGDDGSGGDGSGDDGLETGSKVTVVGGVINEIKTNEISVSGTTFRIGPETVIVNDSDVVIPFQWLQVGAEVTIAGLAQADSYIQAEQIVLHIPAAAYFHLHQNYPNPFREETTIQVELFENGTQSVRIVIYDALGREAEVLSNDELGAGLYVFKWKPAQGIFANGLYFCRIEVNGFSQTRTMVLQR